MVINRVEPDLNKFSVNVTESEKTQKQTARDLFHTLLNKKTKKNVQAKSPGSCTTLQSCINDKVYKKHYCFSSVNTF